MPTAREIACILEDKFPLALQEKYDNSGFQCGNPEQEIRGVLFSLDITEAIVEEAISSGYTMVISHHPLLFNGLKSITGKTQIERVVMKAIKHDVVLYSCHTNADNDYSGVNQEIAQTLGLLDTRILRPMANLMKLVTFVPESHLEKVRTALFQAGAGKIGHYDQASFTNFGTGTFRPLEKANPYSGTLGERSYEEEVRLEVVLPDFSRKKLVDALKSSHPYEEVAYDLFRIDNTHSDFGSGIIGSLASPISHSEFLQIIKESFGTKMIRYTEPCKGKVKRVALCGGSGSFLISDAIHQGADVFLTSDIKYHQFFEAESKISLVDIGHFEGEQYTSRMFYKILKEKFPNFALRISEIQTNPVFYHS